MPGGQDPKSRERSVSGDFEDTDFESHAGDANPPGKPGRKKNPNSQAARRDQNRIAQREFRLRKQQRIRDLEARVEILSGGKDEALGEMRNILKDLMAENQTLRNLLRSLAAFIGEGAGGLLPKLGWDLVDFNDYINKSETDTAWEGYHKRKKGQNGETESSSSANIPTGNPSHKRSAESDPVNSRSKKPRNDDNEADSRNGFPMLVPMPTTSLPPAPLYPPSSRNQERNGIFSELLRGSNGSPMFLPSPATGASSQYPGSSSSNLDGYSPSSYLPGSVNLGMEQPSPYDSPTSAPVSQQRLHQASDASDEIDHDDDPKKNEAYKLIHYHLENYKRNSSYCLPASLRPTVVQRTIPHESVIDRVLHPELRDRMILLRQRFELVDCLVDHRQSVTIHGDDVLAHSNWEMGENFIRKYSFLIDTPVLRIANKWRRDRGESEIVLPETND
ncbi:hypothetical protein GALMADRAFT_235749 [Galerina marginata CBS 339.88]|uniref:BZIP domain-containing protein n=1 Tax=Galerina marginata (strain CBS 339.88) TaxID=685588 RepID=A0A067TK80_GALM3|nr:hypothetical protein GALMADRAFT_235749 [Galerina marginata CBS 339.88]